ncbi:MarR family winged helix-turn-helix transcriptional regulator [Arachidicoccus soli]|uniref:MarR family transcriptional regulator n=1 Tax=Arachidicoccus soli TaxID=2341117 RepID=A0A386HNJ9_9BACT|nr:MarR family transcriptional regulator [Arachidicoccus soli]AYD47041.1 MarR family transcriptional regulator [Arachidicoccus soli]
MQNKLELTGLLARTTMLYRMKINALLFENNIDLSSEMCGTLIELWKADGKSQQELADTLHKDKGGMTKIIKNLERRTLIICPVDKTDRRQKKIQLTSKGKELQKEVEPLINKLRLGALEGIASQDLDITDNVLKSIILNLDKKL